MRLPKCAAAPTVNSRDAVAVLSHSFYTPLVDQTNAVPVRILMLKRLDCEGPRLPYDKCPDGISNRCRIRCESALVQNSGNVRHEPPSNGYTPRKKMLAWGAPAAIVSF